MFHTEKTATGTLITIPKGVHRLDSPMKITGQHIMIRGEEGAILRGTRSLGGHRWIPTENGAFYTETEYMADALYIGGRKYRMARYPKYDPNTAIFNGYAADCTSPEKAAEWADPSGGYIHAMHRHYWGGYSYKITGKDANNNLEYIGGWQNNRQMGMHKEFRFVENIFEEMTLPGEWFFDEKQKRVYVIPCPGDDLSTAEIAVSSSFFCLEDCEDVTIENITFEKSARTFMLTKEPLLRSDWTIYRGGAIYVHNSKSCRIADCLFEDIGSNAVFVDGNCEDISLERSLLREVGGSGACFVGRADSVRDPLFEYGETQAFDSLDLRAGPKSDNYPRNCSVDNCLITRVGTVEKQAAGIEISMAFGIRITNCSIYDVSRAGINISEGTFGGHLIDGCDVFDTVKETGDHGSFNSWGRDRYWRAEGLDKNEAHRYALLDCIAPITIRNNRFRCDRGWDIDLDDGSSNYIIFNNLCLNGGLKLREGFFRKVYNKIIVNNSIHLHVWYPNSGDVIERNVVFSPYKPIKMPLEAWGDTIDCNLLHTPQAPSPVQAAELAVCSRQDAHSLKLNCRFRDPQNGDYTVTNPDAIGFENFMAEFGVKHPPLRALAKTPVLPDFCEYEPDVPHESAVIHGIRVKNIDTDGEMSAYGTSGHSGVIVLEVPMGSDAMRKGLREGDVIVGTGRSSISSMLELRRCTNFYNSTIHVLREQKSTLLF